ncbi:phage holin family protein [Acaryochloris sp. CCMEE 5410]|uniref:phage holin family protein n=1 Tax=Acaryochloris sp. CCMEE 5410 TaxID=310037 RepID=UPI0002484CCD|nr:phage holin family protein [Acaryochloris sp. CCMEE 5410]
MLARYDSKNVLIGSALTLLATALSLLVVDIIFPGINLSSFPAALIGGGAIGVVNAVVKPVISLLSLPLTFLSLGAFSLIVNGFCLWLAALFVPGFKVSGLLSFLLAPVLLSFVNTLLSKYFSEKFPSYVTEDQ